MNQFVETNYQVISAVGVQGNYRMYVAEHRQERTRWAIKELPKTPGDTDSLDRATEIKDMADPLLPKIREIYDDENVLTTVEEYIPGVSLGAYVKESGAMEEEDVLGWMSELAGFFFRLHNREKRTILGDLDPGDLRLMPDNSVRIEDYSSMCGLGVLDNAPYYGFRAPEMRLGGTVGPWTDLYSLGAVAYYALTGKDPDDPPFRYYPLRHYNASASAGMEYILNKCLQQNPKARYQNAEELLYDLQHIDRFNRVLGRYKGKLFLRGALVAVLILAGGALAVYGNLTMRQEKKDSYTAYLESASVSAEEGDYDAAFRYLGEAEKIMDGDVRAYEQWADYLYRSGRYAECADYCTKQLSEFPESKSLVLNLAMSDYRMDEYRVAAEYFRLAGEDEMTQEQMFAYLNCLRELDRAEELSSIFYNRASVLDEGHRFYIQGLLDLSHGDLASAETSFNGAMAQSAGDRELHLKSVEQLADVYWQMFEENRDTIALTRAYQLLEASLQETELANRAGLKLRYLAVALEYPDSETNADELAESARALIDGGEKSVEAYCVLIHAYRVAGDRNAEFNAALEATEAFPDSWKTHARLAIAEVNKNPEEPEKLDVASIYSEYLLAQSLIGDEEPDASMLKLDEIISHYRELGLIKD